MNSPSDDFPLWAVTADDFFEQKATEPLRDGALGLLVFSRAFDDPHAMVQVVQRYHCPTMLAMGNYSGLNVLDALPAHVEVGRDNEPYAMVRWRLRRSKSRLG